MLGCHDFCGHYEWTFHYLRRRWGQEAVRRYWAEAIGGESQRHYTEAGQRAGLRGLYNTWTRTGQDEACDWTFTLDEQQNFLRWDMRACPSKGFLLAHDLNADEDYCDHCMGWTKPLVEALGMEVVAHEHNHCGQCWGLIRVADRPCAVSEVACDVRRDPRWAFGYLDVWRAGQPLPLVPRLGPWTDPCALIEAQFADCRRVLVVSDTSPAAPPAEGEEYLATGRAYATPGLLEEEPRAVIVGHDAEDLPALAARWLDVPLPLRPLVLHPYLPRSTPLDFTVHRLPRPLPILPLLIRKGRYVHRPGEAYPTPAELATLLTQALGKG
jgi:hypothetical protein